MSLTPGTRLGPYEIVSALGAGGMGEDLSQRIARGAIPLDDALPIARQIAEALEGWWRRLCCRTARASG